jgi:spore coat protein U-like protein
MKRLNPVCATGPRRDKRLPHNAVKVAVTLWVCLTTMSFGSYDVYAAGATNGNATVTVSCDLNPPPGNADINYTISLSTGSSNSFVQRQMKSGANTFGYNLYTTNAYSVIWGDGVGSTATVSGSMRLKSTNSSQSNTHTVYGRIPALQDVAVASDYQDNVTY